MDVDDLATSEVLIAVAATAAVLSSRVRHVARRGLVYGLAGALSAGDMVMSFGKGVAGGVQGAVQTAGGQGDQETGENQPGSNSKGNEEEQG